MRFIEENLGVTPGTSATTFNRHQLTELQELVARLAELYQELGLRPQAAWRSALADFAGDFPAEIAVLHKVRSEV